MNTILYYFYSSIQLHSGILVLWTYDTLRLGVLSYGFFYALIVYLWNCYMLIFLSKFVWSIQAVYLYLTTCQAVPWQSLHLYFSKKQNENKGKRHAIWFAILRFEGLWIEWREHARGNLKSLCKLEKLKQSHMSESHTGLNSLAPSNQSTWYLNPQFHWIICLCHFIQSARKAFQIVSPNCLWEPTQLYIDNFRMIGPSPPLNSGYENSAREDGCRSHSIGQSSKFTNSTSNSWG